MHTLKQQAPNQDSKFCQNGSDPSQQEISPATPLIRGVTDNTNGLTAGDGPQISHCLDWLTYTIPWADELERAFPEHGDLFLTGEVLPNIKGYNRRIALNHGSLSYYAGNPQQKICLQFTGRDLRHLSAGGLDPRVLLDFSLRHKGVITRLDFAVDYHGPSSPRDLFEGWNTGGLKTSARQCKFILSSDRSKGELKEAYSTYVGSNTSTKMVRCYDKADQMGALGPWTRIEFVARKGYADPLAEAMTAHGIGPAGKQALRQFVQCDIDWFNHAITGPSTYIEAAERTDRNTKGWLLGFILPLLIREIGQAAVEGDFEVRDTFLKALSGLGRRHRVA